MKRITQRHSAWLSLSLPLLAAAEGCANAPAAEPDSASTTQALGSLTISGTVAGPGGPLVGAKVTLGGNAQSSTLTVAGGAYSFTGLSNGSYSVSATLANCTFSPPIPLNNLTANAAAKNFAGSGSACGSAASTAGGVGPAGPVGPQGPPGVQGPQGLVGASGPVGPVGPQGLVGPPGLNGAPGVTGASGPTGAQGIQGVAGPTGAQGPAGSAALALFTQVGPSGGATLVPNNSRLDYISVVVPTAGDYLVDAYAMVNVQMPIPGDDQFPVQVDCFLTPFSGTTPADVAILSTHHSGVTTQSFSSPVHVANDGDAITLVCEIPSGSAADNVPTVTLNGGRVTALALGATTRSKTGGTASQ
jgi:Collagen triple helix repeat (20 copies)